MCATGAEEGPASNGAAFNTATPCLSGRDIRDLGYKPGPLFTKIFDSLRRARWKEITHREEESVI